MKQSLTLFLVFVSLIGIKGKLIELNWNDEFTVKCQLKLPRLELIKAKLTIIKNGDKSIFEAFYEGIKQTGRLRETNGEKYQGKVNTSTKLSEGLSFKFKMNCDFPDIVKCTISNDNTNIENWEYDFKLKNSGKPEIVTKAKEYAEKSEVNLECKVKKEAGVVKKINWYVGMELLKEDTKYTIIDKIDHMTDDQSCISVPTSRLNFSAEASMLGKSITCQYENQDSKPYQIDVQYIQIETFKTLRISNESCGCSIVGNGFDLFLLDYDEKIIEYETKMKSRKYNQTITKYFSCPAETEGNCGLGLDGKLEYILNVKSQNQESSTESKNDFTLLVILSVFGLLLLVFLILIAVFCWILPLIQQTKNKMKKKIDNPESVQLTTSA